MDTRKSPELYVSRHLTALPLYLQFSPSQRLCCATLPPPTLRSP
jgi:hypothetical protein